MKEEKKYKQFRCPGVREDGSRCNKRLFDYDGELNISIRCKDCKNTITVKVEKIDYSSE